MKYIIQTIQKISLSLLFASSTLFLGSFLVLDAQQDPLPSPLPPPPSLPVVTDASSPTIAPVVIPYTGSTTNTSISPMLDPYLNPTASFKKATTSQSLDGRVFTRFLGVGSVGGDVVQLQKFLNQNGFAVAKSGPGSPGSESSYFGNATKKAVAEFQKANGITQTGTLGPITRALVNKMRG